MTPQFLYPDSRQFPFDEACHKIVLALEAANWDFPGIRVEFREYGSYRWKGRLVSKIIGPDFYLWFSRIQRRSTEDPKYNNTAGVHDVHIPGHNISVYDDESGPTYYRYNGDNWERDENLFMGRLYPPDRVIGNEHLLTSFSGQCRCKEHGEDPVARMPHYHPHKRSPLLVSDDEREEILMTDEVLELFVRHLEDVVLPRLKRS